MNDIKKITNRYNKSKILFTAGPASLIDENVKNLKPCFGRGDKDYLITEKRVLKKINKIAGNFKNIVCNQGSGSLSIEIEAKNFLFGKILVINTGYYSDRIKYILSKIQKENLNNIKKITEINWDKIDEISEKFDWIFCCYTETSMGLKLSISEIKKLSKRTSSKIMLDATGSIGLESNHNVADVVTFSSSKGLFGLTGASFICFDPKPINEVNSFYLDINTHINKKVTGPYHTIYSLDKVLEKHEIYKYAVKVNKEKALIKWKNYLSKKTKNQPLLCTHVKKKILVKNKKVIMYQPRVKIDGNIICHLGEVHLGKKSKGQILDYLS